MSGDRYSVVLDKPFDASSAAAELFSRKPTNLHEAVDFLSSPREVGTSDVLIFERLGMLSAELSFDDVQAMRNKPGIKAVNPVRRLSFDERPESYEGKKVLTVPPPSFIEPAVQPVPWNIAMVRANLVWGKATGKGVKVAVMDSGIAKNHPDLPVSGGMCFAPGLPPEDWDDTHGHGTHCAGIIGARNNATGVIGVAPDCELYALKVHDGNGGNTDWIFAAMEWAAKEGMHVASLSQWDTTGVSSPDAPFWEDLQRGAEILLQAGCLVVGIAGNCGHQANHWVSNPGRCPGIVATGSVDRSMIWAATSAYGPDGLPEEQAVEIAAPGVSVLSTLPGGAYGIYSGTSMACPHVSGAAALLREFHPDWNVQQIRAHIKSTSSDLGPKGRDAKYGFGLLDCERALSDPIP